jgi:predicted ATPase
MHVSELRLQNFKRFRDLKLDFRDPETGWPRPLIVLVGENGSGKSTVLQAIAAALGTATHRINMPSALDWPGFNLRLANQSWRSPLDVDLTAYFDLDEIDATQRFFADLGPFDNSMTLTTPGNQQFVDLRMHDDRVTAEFAPGWFQFRGREYAKQVLKKRPEGHKVFERVGSVFWYTEHRTSTSLTPESNGVSKSEMNLDDRLRRRLSDYQIFHERVSAGSYQLLPGQRDIFADIERTFSTVFPARTFECSVPRSGIDEVTDEPWYYLSNAGGNQYELSEMSGGERAIFPILFDFANWQIHNSVILIDEFELHLHPPLQQALLRALSMLGKNNQFIITTHSESVVAIVPDDAIYHMEDYQ